MANGFSSLHPKQVSVLKELGVTSGQVMQGWGSAPQSVGFHTSDGTNPQGHQYSSCVDLSHSLAERSFIDRLIAASWCPFVRDTGSFANNTHIHCVTVGLTNWQGNVCILPGPREQIIDFTRGKDGLVDHGPIGGEWAPTPEQQGAILAAYSAWAPGVATAIWSPPGNLHPEGVQIPCYAFLEGNAVRCEARPLLEYWGVKVGWDGAHITAAYKGKELDLSGAQLKVEGGFTRASVRGIINEIEGLKIGSFTNNPDGSATVKIAYA